MRDISGQAVNKNSKLLVRQSFAVRGACLLVVLFILLSGLLSAAFGQVQTIGKWTTQSYTMPINPIHAALLHTGNILIVAGSGNCPPSQSGCPSGPPYGPSNNSGALLVNPSTGAISQFTLTWDMFCNGMVVLSDGRAFINSGTIQYDPFYGQLQSAIFDPSSNTFTTVQNMAHGRWYPGLVTLADGRIMTFSGDTETGSTNSSVEIYTVGSGWSQPYSSSWTPDLYPRLHLLPNGTVLIREGRPLPASSIPLRQAGPRTSPQPIMAAHGHTEAQFCCP
jgi:hypothetical protein